MTQWYYAKSGQQQGPVGFEELRNLARSGGISREDLVWSASMKDWLPAGTVDGLFSAAASVPENIVVPAADPSNPYAVTSGSFHPPVETSTLAALDEIPPGSEPLDIIACIKRGFELTKRHFLIIFLTGLVFFAISMALEIPFSAAEALSGGAAKPVFHNGEFVQPQPSASLIALQVVHFLASQVLSMFLTLGSTRIALNIVSGNEASIGQLFSQGDKLLGMIGASIIFWLAVAVGCLLLIVPGIYIALRFGQYTSAIVDRNMGIMEAFRYSSSITTNNRLNLFGLAILSFLIVLAGLLVFCVGALFGMAIVWVATAVAYRWMQYGNRVVLDHPGTQTPLLAPNAPQY